LSGYRLRFYPAKGLFYGPANLKNRWNVVIPDERLFINPASPWCTWNQRDHPARATPTGQYAADRQGISYGLIDDVCDGMVSCTIDGSPILFATARIVVAPPDFAPDRRPVVSLADGLKDRDARAGSREAAMPETFAELESAAIDIFERAFENAGLMNMDWIARYFGQWNADRARQIDVDYDPAIFFPLEKEQRSRLPLSQSARRNHRRFVVARLLRDMIRRDRDFIARMLRDPLARNAFNTRQMPALMRGADGRPLHLTSLQVALLKLYAERVPRGSPPEGAQP
jgi:hypothetical protein